MSELKLVENPENSRVLVRGQDGQVFMFFADDIRDYRYTPQYDCPDCETGKSLQLVSITMTSGVQHSFSGEFAKNVADAIDGAWGFERLVYQQ